MMPETFFIVFFDFAYILPIFSLTPNPQYAKNRTIKEVNRPKGS